MKTKNETQYICCGNTNFCKECHVFPSIKNDPLREGLKFTLNAFGRCDYYRGPNSTKTHITITQLNNMGS